MPTSAKSTKPQKANGSNSVKRNQKISRSTTKLRTNSIAQTIMRNNKTRIRRFRKLIKDGALRLPLCPSDEATAGSDKR